MTSFIPNTIGTGLSGAAIPRVQEIYKDFRPKGGYKDEEDTNKSASLLITIIITIILFVLGVAFYDIIKIYIANKFAYQALIDKRSNNTQEDISRIALANQAELEADIVFFIVVFIIALILLPILFYTYSKL